MISFLYLSEVNTQVIKRASCSTCCISTVSPLVPIHLHFTSDTHSISYICESSLYNIGVRSAVLKYTIMIVKMWIRLQGRPKHHYRRNILRVYSREALPQRKVSQYSEILHSIINKCLQDVSLCVRYDMHSNEFAQFQTDD